MQTGAAATGAGAGPARAEPTVLAVARQAIERNLSRGESRPARRSRLTAARRAASTNDSSPTHAV